MSVKREVVAEMTAHGVSARAACRAVGLSCSSQRYQPRAKGERRRLAAEVVALAQQHRRYGYRRITALLRRQGQRVHAKRVWRIWKSEALSCRVSGRVDVGRGLVWACRRGRCSPTMSGRMTSVRTHGGRSDLADESWREPVYGLIMPAENIHQSRRPALHVEKNTLEDDTAARFGPDAIEICLIIPVEILLSRDVVKIHTWITLIQNAKNLAHD